MDTRRAVLDIQRTQRMIARAMEDEKLEERIARPASARREDAAPRPVAAPSMPDHRAG